MITMPDLQTALLDLLHETRDDDLRLIVGGGYGVYLKRERVRKTGDRTLLLQWPEVRATNDLDLFLRAELLTESEKLEPLSAAIKRLGYEVIETAKYYQFAKPGPTGGHEGSIKIDLLTGPRHSFPPHAVRMDSRRIKPRRSVGLHAHPTEEAVTLEERLLPVKIDGNTSHGTPCSATVFLPHPFTFVLMKLFAFRDRIDDVRKDNGSYHALDIYTILATTTEVEWEQAKALRNENEDVPKIAEACGLVAEYFSGPTSKGILRLRESPYYRPELQLDEFRSSLTELFPPVHQEEG